MRIAYLVNYYPAVTHVFIRREIHALERRGIEITRIAVRGWNANVVDGEDLLERDRTRYLLREGALRPLAALGRMLLTRPARLFCALLVACRIGWRAERPLLVHLVYVAEACRIEPWLRAARIEHLHAHFGTNSAAVAMFAHILGGPSWSFTVHGSELTNAEFIGLAEKISRCAFVVAISSYARAQLYRFVEHQRWPKVQVVHCGLDHAAYTTDGSAAVAVPRLVCVGRLFEAKGQLLLVEAARRLAMQGTNLELVLVGDGESRGDIETLIARENLEGTVRITGWCTNEQVRDEILAARALVLPSFAEGIPIVIMEAMALMRPVISTFVGGIPELIIPGEHGWLVPAGDVDALSRAMRECLETPTEVLARMGKAARKRVIERHNADTLGAQLSELFRAAIAGQLRPTDDVD